LNSKDVNVAENTCDFTVLPAWARVGAIIVLKTASQIHRAEITSISGTTASFVPKSPFTGTAQAAINWFELFRIKGDPAISESKTATEIVSDVAALHFSEKLLEIPLTRLVTRGFTVSGIKELGQIELGNSTIETLCTKLLDNGILQLYGFYLDQDLPASDARSFSSSATDVHSFLSNIAERWTDADQKCWFQVNEAGVIKFNLEPAQTTSYSLLLKYPNRNLASITRELKTPVNHLIPLCAVHPRIIWREITFGVGEWTDAANVTHKMCNAYWFMPPAEERVSFRIGDTLKIFRFELTGTIISISRWFDGERVKSTLELRFSVSDFAQLDVPPRKASLRFQAGEFSNKEFETTYRYKESDGTFTYLYLDVEEEIPDDLLNTDAYVEFGPPIDSVVMGVYVPDVKDGIKIYGIDNSSSSDYSIVYAAANLRYTLADGTNVTLFDEGLVGGTLRIDQINETLAANVGSNKAAYEGDYKIIYAKSYVAGQFDSLQIIGHYIRGEVFEFYIRPRINAPDLKISYIVSPTAIYLADQVGFASLIIQPVYKLDFKSTDADQWKFFLASAVAANTIRLRMTRESRNLDLADFAYIHQIRAIDNPFAYVEDSTQVGGHLIIADPDYADERRRILDSFSSMFTQVGEGAGDSGTGNWSEGSDVLTDSTKNWRPGQFTGFDLQVDSDVYLIKDNDSTNIYIEGTFKTSGSNAAYLISLPSGREYYEFIINEVSPPGGIEANLLGNGSGLVNWIAVTKIVPLPIWAYRPEHMPFSMTEAQFRPKFPTAYGGENLYGTYGADWSNELAEEVKAGTRTGTLMQWRIFSASRNKLFLEWTDTLDAFKAYTVFEEGDYVAVSSWTVGAMSIRSANFLKLFRLKSIRKSGANFITFEVDPAFDELPAPGDYVIKASLQEKSSINSYGEFLKTVKFENLADPLLVRREVHRALKRLSQPEVSYSIDVADLWLTDGDQLNDFSLGGRCRIVDAELDLDVTGLLIVEKEVDLISPVAPRITVANVPPRLFSELAEMRLRQLELSRRVERLFLSRAAEKCVFWDSKLQRCLKISTGTPGLFCYTKAAAGDGCFRADGLPITKADCPFVTYALKAGEFGSLDGRTRILQTGEIAFLKVHYSTKMDANGWRIQDDLSFVGPDEGCDLFVERVWLNKIRVMDADNPGYEGDFVNTEIRVRTENGLVTTSYPSNFEEGTAGTFTNDDAAYAVTIDGTTYDDYAEVSMTADEDELLGWWVFRKDASGNLAEAKPIVYNSATDASGLVKIYVPDNWSTTGSYNWLVGLPADHLPFGKGFIIELKVPSGANYDIYVQWQAEGWIYES